MTKSKKKYYPWIICVCCLVLHMLASGLVTISFSTHTPYLRETIDLTNTQVSLVTTIRCLSTMIFLSFMGAFYKRVSLRLGTLIGCLFLAVGYVLFGFATSVTACYIAAVILGIPYAMSTMVPISIMIRNWFKSSRSTALAVCTCGSSVCTVVFPPITTQLVEHLGLKTAFLVEAGIILTFSILLFILIRDKPEDLGQIPWSNQNKETDTERKVPVVSYRHMTKYESWVFLAMVFLIGCVCTPFSHSLSIHFHTAGYSSVPVAFAVSVMGFVMAIAKFSYGLASDRFGTYRVNYFFCFAFILASLFVAFANGKSVPLLYLSTVFCGLGLPIGTIGMTLWAGDLSSQDDYAKLVRHSQLLFTIGSLIGGPLPGIIADRTGSYSLVYIIYAFVLVVTSVVIQAVYKKKKVIRKIENTPAEE